MFVSLSRYTFFTCNAFVLNLFTVNVTLYTITYFAKVSTVTAQTIAHVIQPGRNGPSFTGAPVTAGIDRALGDGSIVDDCSSVCQQHRESKRVGLKISKGAGSCMNKGV